MVREERWEEIHRMHRAGHSVLVIGRQLEMGRKDGPPLAAAEHLGNVPASSQCWQRADRHLAWLVERAPQAGYSARILFQELTTEQGCIGGTDTVKHAGRPPNGQTRLAMCSVTGSSPQPSSISCRITR